MSEPTLDFLPHAACKGKNPAIFFPARGEMSKIRAAKAACEACEVREECLEWALHHEMNGVWGGTCEKERIRIRRRRGIRYSTPVPSDNACGTPAAYRRHLRNGTPICVACRDARNSYQNFRAAVRRGALFDEYEAEDAR